ncbi:F-box only protein 21 [Lasioglossum baleicum]|uniref:F-box only protein 21 n=1 Tax=Lasioglossum baleicum TaxID=434251 RepID=UPI003FCD4CC4
MTSDIVDLLPSEIIVRILEDKQLGFSDVINLASTCKSLHKIIDNDNILWRTKYFQRWPSLKETYHINKESEYYVVNWKERIRLCLDIKNQLFQQLSLMSSRHYNEMSNELPNSAFKIFDPLFRVEAGAPPFAYYILVDELISLIKAPALASNLTHRYYGLKVVRYLKQSHLKEEWQKFISLPPREQTLERGATIVAQWSQPERHVTYSYIASLLDEIAEQTKALLKEQHPDHSIFSTPPEQFVFWRNNIIDDNQWNVLETVQATEALRKVLFQNLGFYGGEELYYSSENSFLDRVLENRRGIPISLAIVFESIARRLGIRCEPVCFPSHFLLRWKETYGPDSDKVENFYIDVMNHGEFITKKQCPQIGCVSKCPIKKYNVRKAATAVEVVGRMASNLEVAVRQYIYLKVSSLRSTLELGHMVQPNDPDPIWKLASLYRDEHIDFTEILELLKSIDQDAVFTRPIPYDEDTHSRCYVFHRKEKTEPKKRKPVVEYAVGMIMKFLEYPCVIIGWDTEPFEGELGVFTLKNDAAKTKYVILRDDVCQYVYQDELQPTKPEWISHQSIGRYFCKFNGTHYVPNEEMAKEYPEDEEVRNRLLQSFTI